MNDLDAFLNSVGLPSEQTDIINTTETPQIRVPTSEPEPQTLSPNDYNDILEDLGFTGPPEAEYEEIDEEESEREAAETEALEELRTSIADGRSFDSALQDFEEALDEASQDTATAIASSQADIERRRSVQLTSESLAPLIPLNSPTLLLDASTSRFSGTEWFNEIQKQSVIVAGIGGIGSNVCFQLARMCPASMVLYDDDYVETANMSGQLFSSEDVGKSKVDAIVDMITKYTSMKNIYAIKQKFESSCEAGDIMICGFDNMRARRLFFNNWLEHVTAKPVDEKKKCLYLDGRLSIDTLQVFALTGDDWVNQAIYNNKYLFSDAEADETICSMKQTTYLACMIGSMMVNLFTNFVANNLDPVIPYDLPFFTEYDAQNMIFKTVK